MPAVPVVCRCVSPMAIESVSTVATFPGTIWGGFGSHVGSCKLVSCRRCAARHLCGCDVCHNGISVEKMMGCYNDGGSRFWNKHCARGRLAMKICRGGREGWLRRVMMMRRWIRGNAGLYAAAGACATIRVATNPQNACEASASSKHLRGTVATFN